jgi:hypothetical protein
VVKGFVRVISRSSAAGNPGTPSSPMKGRQLALPALGTKNRAFATAQWKKPKTQSRRMMGIGIPISQSSRPLPMMLSDVRARRSD